MAWYILTWNPDVWTEISDQAWDRFARTGKGELATTTWSTGGRKTGIQPGDGLIFLRQGARGRGVLALGEALGAIFQDTHYNDPSRDANYVEVRWTAARPVGARIPTEVLIDRAPEVPWDNLMGSGVKLPDSAVKTILELWGDARPGAGPAPAGRQPLFQRIVTHAEGNAAVQSRDLAHLEKLIGTSGRPDLVEPFLRGCAASGCRIKVVKQEVTVFQDGFKAFYARGNRAKSSLDLHFHERDPRFARLRATFPTEELVRGYWGVNLGSATEIDRCFGELTPRGATVPIEPARSHAREGNPEADEALPSKPNVADGWDEEGQEDEAFTEGGRALRLHLTYERDRKLVELAKARWARRKQGLRCDVCWFSFEDRYGNMGTGYIEAHHRTPIAELNGPSVTRVEDLAPVCANCHRMLHREPKMTVEALQRRMAALSLAKMDLEPIVDAD